MDKSEHLGSAVSSFLLSEVSEGPGVAEDISCLLYGCRGITCVLFSSRGGAYVGMAGLLSLVIGGNMASEFITQKAVFAALFPINLLLVLTTGGQLFTGNSATMAIGIYEKKCTTKAPHHFAWHCMALHGTGPDPQLDHRIHRQHLRLLVD